VVELVSKVLIKKKIRNIKSTISEKKEDVNDKIKEMKQLNKDKKNDVQVKDGEWWKLAPKIFA